MLVLTILVALALVGCGEECPSTLTMLSITEGDVSVMKEGTDDWTEVEVGMELEVGDAIKTGDDSGAEITFFDGSTMELEAGTEIEVLSLDFACDTGVTTMTLEQTIGTTISRITKLLDPASSYEVETPTGVAGVRGSILIVTVGGNGTTLITNEEGSVYAIGQGVELQITLTVTAVNTSGTVGAVNAWDADGSFTYDPNGQFEYLRAVDSTTDSFAYTVSDGNGGTDTATVTITVNGVNDAPTGISLDNSSVAENQPSGTAVGNFSTTDPDTGDTFTCNLVSGEGDDDNASFTIADSQLRAVASFDYETKNSYSIRVRTTDSGTLYYEEAFNITVTNANDPPVAVDDTATTPKDTPVTIDVLNNDSDIDGDTLTVDSVTQGASGSVTNNGNDVTYTPAPGFSGTDSFTYTISDGNGGTDMATVTVTVTGTPARINIQIDKGRAASIYIWDDTIDWWATDEDTQELVDGTNHITSDTITVAEGHYYYVWVEAADVIYYVKNCPKDWIITSAPEGDGEAAFGYTTTDSLDSVHFTIKKSKTLAGLLDYY
jgi:VCBS repeat-containing protein